MLTGPRIIAGRRPLEIVRLIGVSALQGPSYAAGGAGLNLDALADARLVRRLDGAGEMALAASGGARVVRRAAASAICGLSASGAARRARRAAGASMLAVTGSAQAIARPGWVPAGAAWAADFVADKYWLRSAQSISFPVALAAGDATFARASTGLYLNASGVWSSFSAGSLRRGDIGALIEPASTNVLTNSEFAGAAPGVVPAGVILAGFAAETGNNYEIQGVDIVNGQRFLRLRLYGTSVGVGVVTISVRSDANVDIGQRWTTSASVELVSGSWVAGLSAVTLRLNGEGGGSSFTPGTMALYTNTRVATLASTGSNLVLRYNTPNANTTPVTSDVVLRIGLPQLELSAVSTSPILTSGTAATRNADALVLKPAAGIYNVTITFDDNSTQVLIGQVITGSGWAVPTNLNRPNIKSISGAAA